MEKKSLNFSAKDSGIAFSAMIVLYLLITLLGQAILLAVTEQGSTLFVLVCSLFSLLALGVVFFYYSFNRKISINELCGVKKVNYKSIIASVLLAFGMMFTFGIVNTLFANALENIGIKSNSINIPLDNFGLFILFSITFALLPAIIEELFFRGLMAKGLSGAKALTICLITALTFALYHGSFAQLIYQFIYGVALFILFKAFGSIIPCMIAHFLNNFVILVLEYLKINVNLANPILIVLGALSLAIFIMLCKNGIKGLSKKEQTKGDIKSFFLPFGLFGTCVCVVLMLSVLF
jgi:membrane protease YdiL (CAAX protease family)